MKTYKCKFCNYSSDRARNVRRHVEKKHVEKQNEKKTPQKVVMENHTTVDEAALKNSIVSESNEFMRKLELGRELMRIITEKNIMKASLSVEHAEALELFEKHKQDNDVKPVVWRPWQEELLKYVNNPTDRRIIWVVGGEGNEGKTFFMKKIEEQYGSHRVWSEIDLWMPTWWIFEDQEGDVDVPNDIFLFDIYRSVQKERINYVLLENIKDGEANVVTGDNVKMVRFTTPNVIMILSHDYPDTEKLSGVRWLIFKISSGMQLEDVTEAQLKKGREEIENNPL